MVVVWTLFGLVKWRLASSLICDVRPTLRARVQFRELLNTSVSNTIDWRYIQSWWYFRPSFVNCCLSDLLSGSYPPPPFCVKVYTETVFKRNTAYGTLCRPDLTTYNITSPHVDSNTCTMGIGQPYARVDFIPKSGTKNLASEYTDRVGVGDVCVLLETIFYRKLALQYLSDQIQNPQNCYTSETKT